MKTAVLSVLLCFALMGFVSVANAGPQTYPLMVRGGQQLKVTAEPVRKPSMVKLVVSFDFAATAAGRDGNKLRAGQGSWLDRGQRRGEPERIEYLMSERDAAWVINYLRSPANTYTFECYNTNDGYMRATRGYVKSVIID